MYTLAHIQTAFQNYLADHSFLTSPRELYEPVDYILSLGGKRLRPALLLMSYNLFNEKIEKALPAAFAIEVFHNFTLLHDDIMDEAPLRRGKPTVHCKYDVNTGILSGDVMLIYAYEYLLKLDKEIIPPVMQVFNKVAIEVCEGQQYDMNFETSESVEIEDYLKMIELKTSVLIAGAMKMGAIIAKASSEDANHLYEFGRNMGIAFQLQDDILDTYGDPEKFGKKVGGDIVQNKKTFLLLKTQALANEEDTAKLNALMSSEIDDNTKVTQVTAIYDKLEVRTIAEKLMKQYQIKAFDHLAKVDVNEDNKKVIKGLAEDLLNRET